MIIKKHYEEIHCNTSSVTSRYDRGGGSPLATLVDTSIIKLWKQADTKNIGKGLFYPQITLKSKYYGEEKSQLSVC